MLSQNRPTRPFIGLQFLHIVLLFIASAISAQARTVSDSGGVILVWDANPEPNVSGYRVYVSEESGAYPNDPIPVTQPEVEISDLENGVTYYCAVTAHNTIGFESSFSAEIEITYVGGVIISSDARLVLLEAEDGNLTAPMVVQSTPDESWIQDDSSSQTGATEISFESQIDAGYYTWCRVKAPSGGSDSLFVSTDGGDEEVFHIYDNPTPPPSSYSNDWVWRRINDLSGQPIVFDLSTGGHTITFRTREAGVQLDRIILCSDRDFVPNDTLPRSGDVLAITESPVDKTIAPGGGVTFDVVAAATGPIQYQWVKDGLAITGETESSLLISPTEYDDAGHYSVFIWSDTAIKTTGAAELTVFEPPFAVTSMSVASDRSITFNLSGQFGQDVQVFASSELDEWTLISTQTNTIGVISVDDPDAQNQTKRFYKLVTIEP